LFIGSNLIVIISNFRGILIVKLRRGQKLHLRAIAWKGLERTMPNGPQTFMYEPDICINQEFMETLTLEEKNKLGGEQPYRSIRH
jgi:hypothetical protein